MRIKFVLSNLTKDDLVELLSTAICDSWLGYEYRIEGNEDISFDDNGEGFIERIARCLLQGKKIEMFDRYAKDENDFHYSNIEHYWDERLERCQGEAEDGFMVYRVSLKDIEDGLSKMLEVGHGWALNCVMSFINYDRDGDFDKQKAETIIQYILWGEEIYG